MATNERAVLWTPSFTLLTIANFGVSMSFFLLVDAGTGIAPVILGALVDPLGYRQMMLVAAGFGGLALVIYLARGLRKAR